MRPDGKAQRLSMRKVDATHAFWPHSAAIVRSEQKTGPVRFPHATSDATARRAPLAEKRERSADRAVEKIFD
jgi:hypothetical protein